MSAEKKHINSQRSAARLAAVQALYQMATCGDQAVLDSVLEEFTSHRLGATVDGHLYHDADPELFCAIVRGAWTNRDILDQHISRSLNKNWVFDRLEIIMLAILRAGGFELSSHISTPKAVIINEYVDVAHAFYGRKEANFVNAMLDSIAALVRT